MQYAKYITNSLSFFARKPRTEIVKICTSFIEIDELIHCNSLSTPATILSYPQQDSWRWFMPASVARKAKNT